MRRSTAGQASSGTRTAAMLFTQWTEIDYTTAMAEAPETTCTTRRRWLRLTPDRVVWALLPLEGLLILSEWFRWFPFNQHKGWTVLVAIAGLGAVLLLMFLWFLAALVFRLRFQFSILSLLVLTVVVAVPFSWLKTEMKRRESSGRRWSGSRTPAGRFIYDYEFDPSGHLIPGCQAAGTGLAAQLLGDDVFADVTAAARRAEGRRRRAGTPQGIDRNSNTWASTAPR